MKMAALERSPGPALRLAGLVSVKTTVPAWFVRLQAGIASAI